MSLPRPLAVGLIRMEPQALRFERTSARIALAVRTNEEGYALLEVFETDGTSLQDAAAFRALEELASRYDVQAVVCAGAVNQEQVERLAERIRLMVIGAGKLR
jgi:hypothetical protein